MFDPDEYAGDRGAIDGILRKIPGFSGYLNREARRTSDQLLRQWMADRLERSKQGLEQFARALVDAAKIDQLTQIDGVRGRLDVLITRLRGAPAGCSGFFDLVQVDEDRLEDVYEHDLGLTEQVDQLVQALEAMRHSQADPSQVIPDLREKIDALDREVVHRGDLLKGTDPDA